jgi:tRNA-dihydrouridine synthase
VKEAVSIPVVANGDIGSVRDARETLRRSGADGVMIGRAALGAPWLPGVVSAVLGRRPEPETPGTPAALGALAAEHLDRLLAHAGAPLGIRLFRKHLAAYADRLAGAPPEARRRALTADNPAEARRATVALFAAADALVSPNTSVEAMAAAA